MKSQWQPSVEGTAPVPDCEVGILKVPYRTANSECDARYSSFSFAVGGTRPLSRR